VTAQLASLDEWEVWRDEFVDGNDRWYARSLSGEFVHGKSPVEIVERIVGLPSIRDFTSPPYRRDGPLF
jgi:hypothetical protein